MYIHLLFDNPIIYCYTTLAILLSICFHEFCHTLVAVWCGDTTPAEAGGLTMNPLKVMGIPAILLLCIVGIGFGRVPIQPANYRYRWQISLVSLAGPFGNFLLLCISAFLIKVMPFRPELFFTVIFHCVIINLLLTILNCLPVPGLDGWNILSNFFPSIFKHASGDFQGTVTLIFFALMMNSKFNELILGTLIDFFMYLLF